MGVAIEGTTHRRAAGMLAIPLLLAMAIVLVAPVWVVPYPPLLDYPNHLASAFVLGRLHDPHWRFSELYRADWASSSNVLTDAALAALERVVPPELAGRILLSVCLLAFPTATWFFLHHANPGYEAQALWAPAIAYNGLFYLGYLSYYLSIAGCLAALGVWLRYLDRPNRLRWVSLLVLMSAIYYTHLFGFVMAGVIVTVYAVAMRLPLWRLLCSWLLFLPGVVLLAASPLGVHAAGGMTLRGWGDKMLALIRFPGVHSRLPDLVMLAVLGTAVAVALRSRGEIRWHRGWTAVAAVLCIAYWLLPVRYGLGWDVDLRVLPLLCVGILAAARVGCLTRWFAATALIVFLLHAGTVTYRFLAEQPRLTELAQSFDAVPMHARVLPIVGQDEVASLFPCRHFWAYGVIRRGWLTPYLFHFPGVQPLRIAAGVYLPHGLQDVYAYDAPPNWNRVRASYGYVWAYNTPQFSRALRDSGRLIFAAGHLEVYRLRRAPRVAK